MAMIENENGLITRPGDNGLAPSMMAEQQRAKSEIEASLTIAAARPRDEKQALDGILISCQRPALAERSQYLYSRGGPEISGPTIDLMQVVAQKWGNLDYGFRELARHSASGSASGLSIVEAYAWDLESNTRRRVQFTVPHIREKKSGNVNLDDPRDVYELVANNAQRRVRTCLENIIPRDIVEAAREECDKTLRANIQDVAKATIGLLKAYLAVGVTQAQIEARIQRRIDAITPAQIIGLQKIGASIRDGISSVSDWFKTEQADDKSAIDKAKDALRKPSKGAKSSQDATPATDAPTTDAAETDTGKPSEASAAAAKQAVEQKLPKSEPQSESQSSDASQQSETQAEGPDPLANQIVALDSCDTAEQCDKLLKNARISRNLPKEQMDRLEIKVAEAKGRIQGKKK